MNDNLPESERWVPVPADFFAESAKNSPRPRQSPT